MIIGILEDDIQLQSLISAWLTAAGHEVFCTDLCHEFLEIYQREAIDLAVLDWNLPDGDGLEVLQTLRENLAATIPIIFCTLRSDESDLVNALNSGADDYVVKPLREAELLARIDAVGRRAGVIGSAKVLDHGPISIHIEDEKIYFNEEEIKVTKKDFLLALQFFRNFGKVLSREYLLHRVWGINAGLDTRTVDVHISRIRRALRLDPQVSGFEIKTIYQHGYRLEKAAKDEKDT